MPFMAPPSFIPYAVIMAVEVAYVSLPVISDSLTSDFASVRTPVIAPVLSSGILPVVPSFLPAYLFPDFIVAAFIAISPGRDRKRDQKWK
jgi:hypothetical protein